MSSRVPIKSKDELLIMHTGSLMNRRKALLQCEESFEASDRVGYEERPIVSKSGMIEFKDCEEWKRAYNELKEILASRENIPNKIERKAARQASARKRK